MPIALLTDFGTADSYAGVLKGVIARIAPAATVIDLTHEIPPFDVLQGALVLYQACRYFPEKTIFVGVVDPGVGGFRRPLLIQTKRHFFIGPDNGLFSLALSEEEVEKILLLNNSDYFLKDPSHTFHGRDIFAPVAAHLCAGISPHEFGPQVSDYEKLKDLEPQKVKNEIVGKILSIDRFGNAITNLKLSFLQAQFPDLRFSAQIGGKDIKEMKSHYAESESKDPFLLFGSTRLLEISAHQGSAAKSLKIKRGDEVRIRSS